MNGQHAFTSTHSCWWCWQQSISGSHSDLWICMVANSTARSLWVFRWRLHHFSSRHVLRSLHYENILNSIQIREKWSCLREITLTCWKLLTEWQQIITNMYNIIINSLISIYPVIKFTNLHWCVWKVLQRRGVWSALWLKVNQTECVVGK